MRVHTLFYFLQTVSALTRVLFWCLFLSLLRNSGNKHPNIPLVSAETVRQSSTYIILYALSWDQTVPGCCDYYPSSSGILTCGVVRYKVLILLMWESLLLMWNDSQIIFAIKNNYHIDIWTKWLIFHKQHFTTKAFFFEWNYFNFD